MTRGGSRNFGKGGVPPPPHGNAEGAGKISLKERFLWAEGEQEIKERVPNMRFPGICDQNPRPYSELKLFWIEKYLYFCRNMVGGGGGGAACAASKSAYAVIWIDLYALFLLGYTCIGIPGTTLYNTERDLCRSGTCTRLVDLPHDHINPINCIRCKSHICNTPEYWDTDMVFYFRHAGLQTQTHHTSWSGLRS